MSESLDGDEALGLHLLRRRIVGLGAVAGRRRRAVAHGRAGLVGETVQVVERLEVALPVQGGAVAEAALELHVPLDLVEGDVAWALDHHLYALTPSPLGELAQGAELGQLLEW